MAYANTHHHGSNLRHTLARPFIAINHMLDNLAEAVALTQEARRVADMSDDALAAEGLTRAEAIQRVFLK